MNLQNKKPKSWADVSVNQFLEVTTLSTGNTFTENAIQKASILLDCPTSIFEEMDFEDFSILIAELSFANYLPKSLPKSQLEIQGEILHLFNDFNQLTIGEFIDLEFFFTNDYHQHLKHILSILYRRKHKSDSIFYPDEFEKYDNWVEHRIHLFDEIPISNVYGIIQEYLQWRTAIFKAYEGVFNTSDDELTEEELAELTPNDRAEYLRSSEKGNTFKKWSWEYFLFKLSQLNFCSIEKVTEMNVIICIKQLAMDIELQISQQQQVNQTR